MAAKVRDRKGRKEVRDRKGRKGSKVRDRNGRNKGMKRGDSEI